MSNLGILDVFFDVGFRSSNGTSSSSITSLHQLQTLVSAMTLARLLPAAAVLCVCGAASVVLYRLFFHPISRFPGPRIAAATGLYQIYYDIWKGGKMTQNIIKLHERYGRSLSLHRE